MAQIIPWWEFEERYSKYFKTSNRGGKALPVRVALGTLIIQAKMNLTDREVVEQIVENPYCQYFIGFERFNDSEELFDPSMLVHFRKRLNKEILMEVNEIIAKKAAADAMPKKNKEDNNDGNCNGTGANGSQNKLENDNSVETLSDDGKATFQKGEEYL